MGCTAVPDEVDEFARGYGVEINPDRTDITDLADGDRTVQCVVYSLDGQFWTGSPSTGDAQVIPFEGLDGPPPDAPEKTPQDAGSVES